MFAQSTLDKIRDLKLYGMLEAIGQIFQQQPHTELSATELLTLLIDHETIYRQNKKHQRLLKQAQLKYSSSCLEDISTKGNIKRNHINQLKDLSWLQAKQNILLTGPTGVGKTYMACAIAQSACRNGYSCRYYRLSKLLEILRIAVADGSYLNFLAKMSKFNCIIIDDWGIEPLSEARRTNLLDIVDDMYQQSSIIITAQLPIEHWHDYIGEPMVADAILDRLVNNAVKINLDGDSQRKNLDSYRSE